MNWKKLVLEPRIILIGIIVLLAIVAMKPSFEKASDGTYDFTTGIKKGLDLEGGVRALILPQDQQFAEQVSGVLNARISAFGLQEKVIRIVEIEGLKYIELELAGSNEQQLKQLIEKQGKFEAKIPQNIFVGEDNNGELKLGDKIFDVEKSDDTSVQIDNKPVRINQTMSINNIPITLLNIDGNTIVLAATVFDGTGVKDIFRDAQNSQVYQSNANNWQFVFTILLSKEAAETFHDVVKHAPIDPQNPAYLQNSIELILDG